MTLGDDIEELADQPVGPAGFAGWSDRHGRVVVRFLGRGPRLGRAEAVTRCEGDAVTGAWARQVHSAQVLTPGAPGECGEGDALVSGAEGLALVVATADCVPLLLAGGARIGAVHAGWRGIVAGVVPAALTALAEDPARVEAWIGPAIGPCCYEVGDEVTTAVVAASAAAVRATGPRGRAHLDLTQAVAIQLRRAGVRRVRRLPLCTRCHPERLWSYRAHGSGAGRNLAWIFRLPEST